MGADYIEVVFRSRKKEDIEKEFDEKVKIHHLCDTKRAEPGDEYYSDDEGCTHAYDCVGICQVRNSGGFTYHSSFTSSNPINTREEIRTLEDGLDKWGPGLIILEWKRGGPDMKAMKRYQRWQKQQMKRERKIHAIRQKIASNKSLKEEQKKWKATLKRWMKEQAKVGPRCPTQAVLIACLPG